MTHDNPHAQASNTPVTQALLPVTAADVDAALATFDGGLVRQNDERNARGYTTFYHPKDSMRAVLEEFSARQSSSNAGGVDDAEALTELLDDIEDEWIDHYLRPDSAERAKCKRCGGDDFSRSSIEHKPGCLVGRIRAALASQSTPTAEPMGDRVCSACDGESKGCTGEYRCLRCEGTGVEPDFVDGLDNRPKANDAAVARAARVALGDWLAWPDAARDGAVPVDNEQTISWLQGLPAKLTTPPTPDRIGKDAVREALAFIDKFFEPWGAWKTAWWEGEVSNDAAFSADNALRHVANILRRATPAQPVDETERLRSRVAKATAILEQGRDGSAGYRQARIIAALSALTDTKGDRPMGDR